SRTGLPATSGRSVILPPPIRRLSRPDTTVNVDGECVPAHVLVLSSRRARGRRYQLDRFVGFRSTIFLKCLGEGIGDWSARRRRAGLAYKGPFKRAFSPSVCA